MRCDLLQCLHAQLRFIISSHPNSIPAQPLMHPAPQASCPPAHLQAATTSSTAWLVVSTLWIGAAAAKNKRTHAHR